MWLCALEATARRIGVSLTLVGSDHIPTRMQRKSWKRPVEPRTVMAQLERWQESQSIPSGRLAVVTDLEWVPVDLLHGLQGDFTVITVDPEQLEDVREAWRRETPRWRKAEWMCLLGSSARRGCDDPYRWILNRLRSQARSLEAFLDGEVALESEGDLVFVGG